MKKKLFVLLMIVAVVAMSLAGCSTAGETGSSGEEHHYSVQTRGLDEAILTVTSIDEAGEKIVEEVNSQGWLGEADMTIGQMMEEWGVESIEPSCEGYDFLGWIAYETVVEVDENGFENYIENELFEGKVFTTEEMMSQKLIDGDVVFYTAWDLICGGCEEHKVCTVYYVDDDCYFVCDDCYLEFATGMGLE